MGEIVFWIFIGGIAFAMLHRYFKDLKIQTDEEEQIRIRLQDDYIYEPNSGAKLTLEEAESGNWINHDNENRILNEVELNKYFYGSERVIEEIANYLKATGHKRERLDDNDITDLEQTNILSKYDSWSYSHSFLYNTEDCRVIFPQVQLEGTRHISSFSGNQILFWFKVEDLFGHYYLRNKKLHEKLLDLIKPDDPFHISDFEVFTIKKCKNLVPIIHLFKHFENEQNLEMEINGENVYIKTMDEPSMKRFLHLENLVKNVC